MTANTITSNKKQAGLTMVELMISLAIAGMLLAAVIPVFGSTLTTSTNTRSKAELTDEAQIAIAIMTARTREACYVYPTGSTIPMPNNWNSNNGNLVVSNNAFAIIEPTNTGYALYAYYLIAKTTYNTNAGTAQQLPASNGQVLMQYRANINITPAPGNRCSQWANTIALTQHTNGLAQVLTDHVNALTVNPTNNSVGLTLQLADNRTTGSIMNATAAASGLDTQEPTLR